MAEPTTHRERMRAKGAQFFTGRQEQVKAFERALKAVDKEFAPPYEEDKTFFGISGEGGLGKTWLCWEFERICKQKDVQSIYLDMSRHDEPPLSSLTAFLRLLRRRFPENKAKKLLGADPFAEFDKEYKRLLNLEKQLKDHDEKKSLASEMIEQVSEVGAKAVVGFGEELPVARTITKVVGKEPLERVVKTAVAGGLGLTRNFLSKVFDKPQDVDFYFNHEEILIKKFTEAVKNYVKRDPLVLLLDTYEEAMELDITLREKLLEDFPRSVIFIFSGRNSIYDNCNLSWRENTRFFELREFDQNETTGFLHKQGYQK